MATVVRNRLSGLDGYKEQTKLARQAMNSGANDSPRALYLAPADITFPLIEAARRGEECTERLCDDLASGPWFGRHRPHYNREKSSFQASHDRKRKSRGCAVKAHVEEAAQPSAAQYLRLSDVDGSGQPLLPFKQAIGRRAVWPA